MAFDDYLNVGMAVSAFGTPALGVGLAAQCECDGLGGYMSANFITPPAPTPKHGRFRGGKYASENATEKRYGVSSGL